MKKTLRVVLIFAVILAALLGIVALAERLVPAAELPAAEQTPVSETVITNEMTPDKATVIDLEGDSASFLGMGAEAAGGVVTIAYPGTYRVSGTLMNGQLVVDLGDFHGDVYIILDGADISCMDGPAIHVKQSDLTVLYLAEGSQNNLRDGESYTVQEGAVEKTGAGIYSADDLVIEGEGALTVTGNVSDGIRSKDALTINGGAIRVFSTDDGLQASDYIEINGGSIVVGTYGDGLATTEGFITVNDGVLDITSGGDGIAAVTELTIAGGGVTILAHGGADSYEAVALGDISAKGLKGEYVYISGGNVDLDTADDGIHAARDVYISGGKIDIASGDDAVRAAGVLDIAGAELTISRSYEALEADMVRLSAATLTAAAENNGVDAGEGGLAAENSALRIDAPRGVSAEGTIELRGGVLDLAADGTDSLFSFAGSAVGGTVIAFAGANDASILLEKGEMDGSLLFLFQNPVESGTRFELSDAAGNALLSFYRDQAASAVLLCSGALGYGQSYTLTVGEEVMEGTVSEGCTVVEPEGGLVAAQPGGFSGFPGGGPRG